MAVRNGEQWLLLWLSFSEGCSSSQMEVEKDGHQNMYFSSLVEFIHTHFLTHMEPQISMNMYMQKKKKKSAGRM